MTPPISRDLIRHPGPKRSDRILSARGTVTTRTVTLPRGSVLMQAVAQAMDDAGCDSGVMVLDGLRIGPYRYVMPGPSHDADHAAWYSAPPMTSPISEVLIPPGAIWNGALHLPMECVDPDNGQYAGLLTKGHAPVCVTFEVMIVAT